MVKGEGHLGGGRPFRRVDEVDHGTCKSQGQSWTRPSKAKKDGNGYLLIEASSAKKGFTEKKNPFL